jgi:hypothetical protein
MGKFTIWILTLLFCAAANSQSTQQSFDALKALAGEWRGKDSLGHQAKITFRVTSGGTAILSELYKPSHQRSERKEDMISMIHVDGNRLVLTHYCSAGNQPRMKATSSPGGRTITFNFFDAANLKTSSEGHMERVVIKLLSPDHHTEEWIFVEEGRESKNLFDMRRGRL